MEFSPKVTETSWDHESEPEIFSWWEREKLYEFRAGKGRRKRIFTIDTPPPYPSGRPWHAGAVAHYAQIDMIARTARMMGYDVYFPIGIDRNGLPVEIYTERKYRISIRDVSREKFIELCKTALDDLEAELISIMKMVGLSGDFANYYRTDSEEYRALTQATFIELWKQGLIYEATRPNNYCSVCGTVIADAEVTYREVPTDLVHMRFKVSNVDVGKRDTIAGQGEVQQEEGLDEIIIASTRPELLCSCRAVIVHPEDKRYLNYRNKKAVVPIYEREVPILPHPAAKPEFGSGAVMVCSYGDYTDVLLFRELGLKEILAIDEGGRMSNEAGPYKGLKVHEASEKVVKDLESSGLLVKVERINHRVPFCERSGNPIEIIPMEEFYLKQLEYYPQLKKMALEMRFHPDHHRQILIDWLDSLTMDWAISRRRYYGTEIPVWYCKVCGKVHLPEAGRYYKPWKEIPFQRCLQCGSTELYGEERTFDTWLDSSISPLFITKYKRDGDFFSKTYPTGIRPQAKDIVRTWLHYTILRCYQLTSKSPFKHAWIMGYGLDKRGERMSKSKGNVIDPIPLLKKYGADSFRFWAASEASLGSDFRVSEERIAGAKKFVTKLWNLARFISVFPEPKEATLQPSDQWILAELSNLIEKSQDGYKDFNFFVPSNAVREFVWNVFASHYVEMVKPRAYGTGFSTEDQVAAWYTLHTSVRTILFLLAPIMPFITEKVWTTLYGNASIHLQRFPRSKWDKDMVKITKSIVDFNSMVWNMKKEKGLSLKDEISVNIPENLSPFERDLRTMHNIS